MWPRFLAGHPDLVKVFLLDAREVPPPMADTGLPDGHGLRPSVVAAVVRRAHAAGLRVAAHIETAHDAELAIDAGVDMLAHDPGYEMPLGDTSARYELSADYAQRAAERGVVMTPTLSLAVLVEGLDRGDSTALVAERRAVQRHNLALLRARGVRIIVGSDWYGRTAAGEFGQMRGLGLWTNLELLRMWAVTTAQAIYPGRRIGLLEPGYEASFLVLPSDPLADLDALQHIDLRVKQGCVVAAPST
jgi:imidazolonepropionase-like amidohydrolase